MAEKCGFVVLEPVEPEIVTREELELRPNAQLRRPEEDEDEGSEDREGEDEPDPLVLDHCEAFFLSYALGCLVVSDGGEGLDLVREILYTRQSLLISMFQSGDITFAILANQNCIHIARLSIA